MKLNNSTEIISVKMINTDDGEESALFERPRSTCHFNEVFRFQNYFIQLRLVWTDVKNGEPMLDADIWTEIKGKKNFLKKGNWHHTEKKLDEKTGKNVYTFKFKNLMLCLLAKKPWQKLSRLMLLRDSLRARTLCACPMGSNRKEDGKRGKVRPTLRGIRAFR